MFEKATTSCIVVILFHVGFELISLCDVIGSVGGGGGGITCSQALTVLQATESWVGAGNKARQYLMSQ